MRLQTSALARFTCGLDLAETMLKCLAVSRAAALMAVRTRSLGDFKVSGNRSLESILNGSEAGKPSLWTVGDWEKFNSYLEAELPKAVHNRGAARTLPNAGTVHQAIHVLGQFRPQSKPLVLANLRNNSVRGHAATPSEAELSEQQERLDEVLGTLDKSIADVAGHLSWVVMERIEPKSDTPTGLFRMLIDDHPEYRTIEHELPEAADLSVGLGRVSLWAPFPFTLLSMYPWVDVDLEPTGHAGSLPIWVFDGLDKDQVVYRNPLDAGKRRKDDTKCRDAFKYLREALRGGPSQ
jgi:hypothetical protein